MKFDRKKFLRTGAFLATSSLVDIDVLAATKEVFDKSEVAPDDEAHWKNVRALFPLSRKWTYLNNGTMGPSPYPVIEAVHEGMVKSNEHVTYSGYEKSKGAYSRIAGVSEDEIALTHNVTEGINIACWGLPLKRKDEVILTTHEHVGNALPWLNRQKVDGIVVKSFIPAKTAEGTIARIQEKITKRTRAIVIPHIPCTQGQVMPVKEICAMAKHLGIYTCIDGAHGVGMLELDLHDIGCDTYASCGHKWLLGPKGTGFLYVRKGFQDTLQPYFVGGGSNKDDWDVVNSPAYMPNYADSAHRYFGGTQSLGLAKGVIAAVDFLENIGMKNVNARIKYLGNYVQESLLGFDDKVELLTPIEERSYCGINSFKIKGVDFKKFNKMCLDELVRIRIVPENGLDCIRVSTHIYNNPRDVDKLIGLVKKAIG